MTSVAAILPTIRPSRPGVRFALSIFIWLLPFHIVVMAILFGGLGLPGTFVRIIAAWKEALVLVLVVGVAIRTALGYGSPIRR